MKHLSQFVIFDWNAFAKDKTFLSIGCSPWKAYDSDAVVGTKISTVIAVDDTDYVKKDPDDTTTNVYEKVVFKTPSRITVPKNCIVEPINPVAKVYGDYNDKLTVTCDNIKILDENKDKAAAR